MNLHGFAIAADLREPTSSTTKTVYWHRQTLDLTGTLFPTRKDAQAIIDMQRREGWLYKSYCNLRIVEVTMSIGSSIFEGSAP